MGKAKPLAAAQATAFEILSCFRLCSLWRESIYYVVDVKGSPALRFLNHNAYAIGDSSGDAAANGGPIPALLCCDGETNAGDPQTHA